MKDSSDIWRHLYGSWTIIALLVNIPAQMALIILATVLPMGGAEPFLALMLAIGINFLVFMKRFAHELKPHSKGAQLNFVS